MSDAARIAAALAGRPMRPMGGNYLVRCPAHDDQSPSLSLRDGDRGLMVHCFSGCDPLDVLAAIREIDNGSLAPRQTSPQPTKGSLDYERG